MFDGGPVGLWSVGPRGQHRLVAVDTCPVTGADAVKLVVWKPVDVVGHDGILDSLALKRSSLGGIRTGELLPGAKFDVDLLAVQEIVDGLGDGVRMLDVGEG